MHKKSLTTKFLAIALILAISVIPVQASPITRENVESWTNIDRVSSGYSRLTDNAQLNQSATWKAMDMLRTNCWSHTCAGHNWWDYLYMSGYYFYTAGENLAYGFTTTEAMNNAWLASPTHAANIYKAVYKDIGVGIVSGWYQGGYYTIVVVHYATK